MFLFLSSAFSHVNAQITGTDTYASSLYKKGKYKQAAMEFELAVFSSKTSVEKALNLMAKAQCQKQSRQFDDALKSINRAVKHSQKQVSLLNSVYAERIFLHYATNEYQLAINDYYRLRKTPELQKKQLYLYVLSRMRNHEDTAFFEALGEFAEQTNNDSIISKTREHYATIKTISPRKAGIMSAIIPGAGAAAAGKPLQGMASLILTGAFGYYGYYSFTNGMFGAGIFTGIMFPLRLYIGGIRYAATMANEKNMKKREKVYEIIEREVLIITPLVPSQK